MSRTSTAVQNFVEIRPWQAYGQAENKINVLSLNYDILKHF